MTEHRPAIVYVASAASLAFGLLFIFVRAPHPWGWEGFDQYHDLALALAQGRDFPTMEVPWGYAYFLAAFYRAFGDRQWIPLVAQAVINSLLPLLVFEFARTWLDRRTAKVAAVLTGLLSFNTVYASTQSSDAVCTCLFMAALVAFAAARSHDNLALFALVGVLTGLAPQFRPNLILIPVVLAGFALFERHGVSRLGRTRRAVHSAVIVACAAAVLLPWLTRNYRLTRTVLPTSVHGGVQLWYGTLQTGEYLNSRARNPRTMAAAPSFAYTSLKDVPLVVEAAFRACETRRPARVELRYWSDLDNTERPTTPVQTERNRYTFDIPPPHRDAVIYYYFRTEWPSDIVRNQIACSPPEGARAPFVYFVSQNHLGDIDIHGDLLDAFDLIRLLRHEAWNETPAFAEKLRAAGIEELRTAVALLGEPLVGREASAGLVSRAEHDDKEARLVYADGSMLTVPRAWHERLTDVTVTEGLAASLMTNSRRLRAKVDRSPSRRPSNGECIAVVEDLSVNEVFYRKEPHMMRRYSALAYDNIRRDPWGFALASAYRAVRLFIIAGTEDPHTTQQFGRSRFVYAAGTMMSSSYLVLFVAGLVIAWRQGVEFLLPLILILYVPVTIAPVLTNMRYTVTVQPLVFMFVAVAITTALGYRRQRVEAREARDREETRTARQP